MEKGFRIMDNKVLKNDKIKSIEKALDLLELLSDNKKEMGITEINKELHMGLSTIHRILTTLKCRGYIVQNQQTSKYMLGVKLFVLGCKVQNTTNLVKKLIPFLQRLSQNTVEAINLGILKGKNVVCIYRIESKEILKTDVVIGTEFPAHCTATGKVLLAFLSEQEFMMLYYNDDEKLPICTPNSISSVKELKKYIKKVKKQGYAIDEGEFKIGINCIAVPIINNVGKAIAAISIAGPAIRFNLSKMKKIKSTLIALSQSKKVDSGLEQSPEVHIFR